MKVVVQRPAQGGGAPFVNSVLEVELRPLESGTGWHVLESFSPVDDADPAGLPILHKGFFDSHLHMVWTGLFDVDLDLRQCRDFEEAIARVTARLREGASYVRGYGWDESRWGMTLGSIARLAEERLPEGKPVVLYRVCGHSALANRTLRALTGRSLSALVTDRDLGALSEQLPAPDLKTCEAAFLRAQTGVIRRGITAVGDMSLDETMVSAVRGIAEAGRLLVDVSGVIEGGKCPSVENGGPFLVRNASQVGPLDRPAVLSIQHWKKFLDGSMGSRTAWLTQPYADAESFGDSLVEPKRLAELAREALGEGFYLSFHAIGDAALDQAIDLGDRLRSMMNGRRDAMASSLPRSRHRIEHGQVVRDDQLRRLAEQGFWMVCAQPHHQVSDATFVGTRLGPARLNEQGYRAASFLRAGIPFGMSSDAPVDELGPDAVIRAVVTHPNPAERLDFGEAVWWYTTGARLELGLEPGQLRRGATVFLTLPPTE